MAAADGADASIVAAPVVDKGEREKFLRKLTNKDSLGGLSTNFLIRYPDFLGCELRELSTGDILQMLRIIIEVKKDERKLSSALTQTSEYHRRALLKRHSKHYLTILICGIYTIIWTRSLPSAEVVIDSRDVKTVLRFIMYTTNGEDVQSALPTHHAVALPIEDDEFMPDEDSDEDSDEGESGSGSEEYEYETEEDSE
ncbi:hypothetical protein DACRYDRAFT_21595 [Dacryopinax primogenitus]|uniref:Uncharacterized protein n=1 Tax=Dacryopinax primogenitus (strain DJM 731) TaxID=1858805 RepID=M5G411_DACPD|nr:uncharacterized protein DACRYDRAFT_21595 [Dacryopinax primogenitus]EJU03414.1 hypothetical protein DACRYDRAFT_21595 [Dacryopinax primogenitus]